MLIKIIIIVITFHKCMPQVFIRGLYTNRKILILIMTISAVLWPIVIPRSEIEVCNWIRIIHFMVEINFDSLDK